MNGLLFVLILAVCHVGQSDVPPKLLLTMYYESECSDSRKFIVEQLMPAINLLEGHLELRIVPFGKANSVNNGEYFECQHGPSECLGNLVQDCALHYMHDKPDSEKVAYVANEMTSLAGTTGNLTCVEAANVPVEYVHQCMYSDEGIQLQLYSEEITKRISPKFIPTITFNDEFNQQIQDQCQTDLIGALCSTPSMTECPPCVMLNSHQTTGNWF